MGACHSGGAADYTLHRLGEQEWAADASVHNRFNVRTWLRFRDDIFIVVGGSVSSRKEFLDGFKSRIASCWKCKVEGLGDEVDMLDTTIRLRPLFNGSQDAKFVVLPFSKPTHRPVPLSHTSAHHSRTRLWPITQVSRLWTNSSS